MLVNVIAPRRQIGTIQWRNAGNFLAKGQWLYKPGKRLEGKTEKREAGDYYVTELYQFAAIKRSRLQLIDSHIKAIFWNSWVSPTAIVTDSNSQMPKTGNRVLKG